MAEGAIYVILEMISLMIENSIGTLLSLLGLSGDLMTSLSFVSQNGGMFGLFVVFGLIFIIGFFLLKFFMGSVKTVFMLIFAGVLIVAFLLVGMSIF